MEDWENNKIDETPNQEKDSPDNQSASGGDCGTVASATLSEDPSIQPLGIQMNVGLTGNGPDMKDQLTAGEETVAGSAALSEDSSLEPLGIQINVGLTGNEPDMKDQLTAGEETLDVLPGTDMRHEKG